MEDKIISIDEINEKIKEKNMTMTAISKATGCSRVTIWRYLNKKREPKISFINKIAKIL